MDIMPWSDYQPARAAFHGSFPGASSLRSMSPLFAEVQTLIPMDGWVIGNWQLHGCILASPHPLIPIVILLSSMSVTLYSSCQWIESPQQPWRAPSPSSVEPLAPEPLPAVIKLPA